MRKSLRRVMAGAAFCVAFLALGVPGRAPAVVAVDGQAQVPRMTGRPDQGCTGLYEWDAWLGENGYSENRPRRCGAPPRHAITYDGLYLWHVPAGLYSLYMHQPEWYVRPKVIPNVHVAEDAPVTVNAEPATDYACQFGGNMGPWEGKGDPWDWAHTWAQTFVARGTSITHVAFKLAGANTREVRVTIHADDGGPAPAAWPQVGPERVHTNVGVRNDNWVAWRSGEVPTTPGERYAVRLEGGGEDPATGFFVHRDAVGPGYQAGTAYADGQARPYDLYLIVSSDSDGTVIPYLRRVQSKPNSDKLAGHAGSWGQTWKAMGRSLAAVDLFGAGGDALTAEVGVRKGGPEGELVGIVKKVHSAWWGPGSGIFAASYSPGEVPLTPGQTYYVEFRGLPPTNGCSAYQMIWPLDHYGGGQAYRDGVPEPEIDLEMTVMEYATDAGPAALPTAPRAAKGKNLLHNGDFERGTPGRDATEPVPDEWRKWEVARTAFWFDKFGRDGSLAPRIIGGNINGTTIDGALSQRVTGLDPAKRYQLSGWVSTSVQTDDKYVTDVGYDPTGQQDDVDADTIIWCEMGRFTQEYELYASPPIQPTKDAISVWLRARCTVALDLFHSDFDDFALVELPREVAGVRW